MKPAHYIPGFCRVTPGTCITNGMRVVSSQAVVLRHMIFFSNVMAVVTGEYYDGIVGVIAVIQMG